MIRIRPEQLAAIGTQDFAERLASLLAELFPEAGDLPRNELVSDVRKHTERAMRYGFIAEQDVAVYVVTAWLLGEDFDREFPAAAQILRSATSPAARAAQLEEWTQALFAALEEGD